MFTISSLLKQRAGFLKSRTVEPGANGGRVFEVCAGGEVYVFSDDAFGSHQLTFEKQLNAQLIPVLGFGLRMSSYSDLGIKLSMFKEEGLPLFTSIKRHLSNAGKEPTSTMTCMDYLSMSKDQRLPLKVTGVLERLVSHFTGLGYDVVEDVATLPKPDYQTAINDCYTAIVEVLTDPEHRVLSGKKNSRSDLEHPAPDANDDEPNDDDLLAIINKAYCHAEGDCAEEDLVAFFKLDHNLPLIQAEEAANFVSKTKAIRVFGSMQFYADSVSDYLRKCYRAGASHHLTHKQVLWMLFNKRGGLIWDKGNVGPKTVRKGKLQEAEQ